MDESIKELHVNFDFLVEENRRKTFKKWVFSDKDVCNADKMAEAGFIFTGSKNEPDAVKCFMCDKSLDGWESTDDPWLEHLKHAPKCLFAKLQKDEKSLTLRQYLDIVHALTEKTVETFFDNRANEIENKFDVFEQKIMSRLDKLQKKRGG